MTIFSFMTRSTNLNGPVPTAWLAKPSSPSCLCASGEIITTSPQLIVVSRRKSLKGCVRLMRKVIGSTTSVEPMNWTA